eukprot:TRINITY_DN14324_c0_g1_i1.p2 TRINITY_DN14324_c0_g1~~TRINITY_DN14324_c0_g1_i1.p2  ORF type:complete len:114 (-),score=1.57 TRINITY_DN14324_c0_g1_i1:50-391(-)
MPVMVATAFRTSLPTVRTSTPGSISMLIWKPFEKQWTPSTKSSEEAPLLTQTPGNLSCNTCENHPCGAGPRGGVRGSCFPFLSATRTVAVPGIPAFSNPTRHRTPVLSMKTMG